MIPKNIFQTIFLTSCIFIGVKSFVEVQSRHKRKNINIGHATALQRQSLNEPNYVFLLPENQTVILRKSDFDHVIYPNVTNVNKFTKSKKLAKSKDSQHAASASYYESSSSDDFDNIVKQNIQTERNFVNFIEEMNLDLSSEEVKSKSDNVKSNNEWDDLGLDGWEGAITQKRKNNTRNK